MHEQREKILLQGQLSVLTLILVSIPPPCYCSNTNKILVIPSNVQVVGYSMHPGYIDGFEISDNM